MCAYQKLQIQAGIHGNNLCKIFHSVSQTFCFEVFDMWRDLWISLQLTPRIWNPPTFIKFAHYSSKHDGIQPAENWLRVYCFFDDAVTAIEAGGKAPSFAANFETNYLLALAKAHDVSTYRDIPKPHTAVIKWQPVCGHGLGSRDDRLLCSSFHVLEGGASGRGNAQDADGPIRCPKGYSKKPVIFTGNSWRLMGSPFREVRQVLNTQVHMDEHMLCIGAVRADIVEWNCTEQVL